MKIYVASSWRNKIQPEVVSILRNQGHEVYDFKNPKEGDHRFHWNDVALQRTDKSECSPTALREALKHPRAVEGFKSDSGAMTWADACVLVLPCGRSAHLEAGWMAGAGKPTIVYAPGDLIEPELMYGLTQAPLCVSVEELVDRLKSTVLTRRDNRERLPDSRKGITHHFVIIAKCHKLKCVAGKVDDTDVVCSNCSGTGVEEVDGYITTGLYPDGRVGEIFVKIGGHASDRFVMLDQWAIAFSVALQHGATLAELCGKFTAQCFWPDGPTDNDAIKRCTSIVDYVCKWLQLQYGPKKEAEVQS